jgi:hypothetical protein
MDKQSVVPSHILHLRAKPRLLYGYHPFVRSQKQLASELGVAESTLSPWLTGTSYQATQKPNKPDSIPTKYYPSFKAIWGIPDEVLEAEDLAAFSKRSNRWTRLVAPQISAPWMMTLR